jgi:ribosomal protein S6
MVEDVIKEDIVLDSADLSAEADEAETQVYEVGFHILPSVEEGNITTEVDSIKSLIEKNAGVLITDESPKLIDLAYTIAKDIDAKRYRFDTAYFGWIKFEMKTDSIVAVKEGMDINKNILRYLIIKTVKESTLVPKTAFTKDDSHKKPKPKPTETIEKTDKAEKPKPKPAPAPVSEEELDKTIEELIVE